MSNEDTLYTKDEQVALLNADNDRLRAENKRLRDGIDAAFAAVEEGDIEHAMRLLNEAHPEDTTP